jgi:hypothetical protein
VSVQSASMMHALDRLADSQFEQAKAMRRSAKAAERSVELTEQMLGLQQANLRVTALLEAKMLEQEAVKGQGAC